MDGPSSSSTHDATNAMLTYAPVNAAEAPFLATAEMHLGRMTLTAPDNMRRRKAEEKEKAKKRKVARATKGERAGVGEVGPSRLTTSNAPPSSSTLPQNAVVHGQFDSTRSRKRPALPASRSSSNLQTLYTVQQSQRPASPTRQPPRPRSAQNATRASSPEQQSTAVTHPHQGRRGAQRVRRVRPESRGAHSGTSGGEEVTRRTNQVVTDVSGQQSNERAAVRAEALRRATQRRRDIYADLSATGLPGASDSEEDAPPPFPMNATRPLSPPAPPEEGREWTEEMRRRQEEYLNNRPPDSPPPAFVSEDEQAEGQRQRRVPSIVESTISSDGDSIEQHVSEERLLWEEDVAAGFSLEDRIQRAQARREANERSEDVLPNANLGQLVMEARARREQREGVGRDGALRETEGNVAVPDEVISTHQNLLAAHRRGPAAKPSMHRRAVSDGQSPAQTGSSSTSNAQDTSRRNVNAAVGTGTGLLKDDGQHAMTTKRGKVTKIRPRPASESHSRFRDDASAAANRRLALWGPVAGSAGMQSVPPSSLLDLLVPTSSGSDRELADNRPATIVSRPATIERKNTSSSSAAGADDESSDSDAEWAKEEKAFEEMQRRKAGAASRAPIDSSEDEASSEKATMPGALPTTTRTPFSELPELGRVGKTIPRAPPPLALGRSRGGAAYSSSSESSSDSDARRLRADEEDSSDSESPVEEEADEDVDATRRHDLDRTALPPPTPKIDKGKQPVRPLPDLPSEMEDIGSLPPSDSDGFSLGRAGTFVEDSASSHDFSDEEDFGSNDATSLRSQRSQNDANEERPAVQNRLKGLFSTSLSASSQQAPRQSNASRQSLDRLFEMSLDGQHTVPTRRVPDAREEEHALGATARRAEMDESSNRPLRSSTRNAENVVSPRMASMTERQARTEALSSISQLQRSQETLPAGVDRDSLAALERLLAGTTYAEGAQSSNGVQPLMKEPSKLTRSGAISNRHSSAFVNPRSVNAPRPLGRLPTITDATRHFPPSQAPQYDRANDSPQRMRPASSVGTPSWMAYIPAQERRALPDPMEPDRRLNGTSASSASSIRGGTSRVSAMVERFEQHRAEQTPLPRPLSPQRIIPLQRAPSNGSHDSNGHADSSRPKRDEQLRRRPPPPPPPQQQPISEARLPVRDVPSVNLVQQLSVPRRQFSPPTQQAINEEIQLPRVPARPSFDEMSSETMFQRSGNSTRQSSDSPIPSTHPSAVTIFGNLYTSEDRSRSSNSLFRSASRPLPVPPQMTQSGSVQTLSDAQTSSASAIDEVASDTQPQAVSVASATSERDDQNHGEQRSESETTLPTSSSGPSSLPRRAPSLGITDLDVFASRLADVRAAQRSDDTDDSNANRATGEESTERDQYDDLHLLAEFLGPAKAPGLTQDEMESLPVGRVEVTRRRVVGKRDDGRDKVKLSLAVAGVKVERCGVCLVQFKEGNMACVFPCLHVFHEHCASKLLRNTKLCPTCRSSVV